MALAPQLSVVSSSPNKRVPRRPSHTFQLRHRPFQIQPFMMAPVLPGETMKNLVFQSRVVTDPIKNPLIGWWMEYYFFYVRLRDLEERDTMENMILDYSSSVAGIEDAVASPAMYHHSGLNYAEMCLKRIVDEYFRDEGEAWDDYTLDGVPLAQVSGKSWMDSVYGDAELPADTIDGDPPLAMDEFESKYQTWLLLRQQKMTEMDFEDYLATFGVRRTLAEKNKPELIRFVRDWSYPTNTVDPTTGKPSSAVSWSIAERADKDRFFAEPGFVVGVTVARPKVYFNAQREGAFHMLSNTLAWLPAIMRDDPSTSLREMAATTGPLGGVHTGASYWVDIRDLFLYGDQFLNFSLAETDAGLVALPAATNSASRYVPEASIDALFAGAEAVKVKQDGITGLTILGTQIDQT